VRHRSSLSIFSLQRRLWKMFSYIFGYNYRNSWQILIVFVPLETGMNASPRSYRFSNFNLTVSPLYQLKLKVTKTADAYCSAFCRTHCSKFSQKVVQCSFLPLFIRKFLWRSFDRKCFTLSWVFIKNLSSNSMWLILTSKVKFNCRDLWRITTMTSSS